MWRVKQVLPPEKGLNDALIHPAKLQFLHAPQDGQIAGDDWRRRTLVAAALVVLRG
jgi:hypothetical protein